MGARAKTSKYTVAQETKLQFNGTKAQASSVGSGGFRKFKES